MSAPPCATVAGAGAASWLEASLMHPMDRVAARSPSYLRSPLSPYFNPFTRRSATAPLHGFGRAAPPSGAGQREAEGCACGRGHRRTVRGRARRYNRYGSVAAPPLARRRRHRAVRCASGRVLLGAARMPGAAEPSTSVPGGSRSRAGSAAVAEHNHQASHPKAVALKHRVLVDCPHGRGARLHEDQTLVDRDGDRMAPVMSR